jgi:hypothetical protein
MAITINMANSLKFIPLIFNKITGFKYKTN